MERHKSIYLYHLDNEVHKLCGISGKIQKSIADSFMMVTKVAFLLCEESLIIPVSNYFESDYTYHLFDDLKAAKIRDLGIIKFASSSYSIQELLIKKQLEHGDNFSNNGYHYAEFLDPTHNMDIPGNLIKRNRSASIDIKNSWISDSGMKSLEKRIYSRFPGIYKAGSLEQLIGDIPNLLGEKAFISNYITPYFNPKSENRMTLDNEINCFITMEYIKSFLDEYDAICLSDIPIIDANCILPKGEKYDHLSYSNYIRMLCSKKYKGINACEYVKKNSLERLYEFKQSGVWKDIMFPCTKKYYYFAKKEEDAEMKEKDNVTIGIITALPNEYAAVKRILGNTENQFDMSRDKGDRYEVAEINSIDNKKHKVVLTLCGEGNNNAAVRCSELVNNYPNVKVIIMCGIAGGMPDPTDAKKHVRLGDIVVSKSVIQSDYGKSEESGFKIKSIETKCGKGLKNAMDAVTADEFAHVYKWHGLLDSYANGMFAKPDEASDILYDENHNIISHPKDSSRDKYPKVHFGCIASANIVVKNFQKREELRKYDAMAFEMEGSGIADASWSNNIGFILIRGVCDYGDFDKKDEWQNYAAMAAAAYMYNLIEYMPAFVLK